MEGMGAQARAAGPEIEAFHFQLVEEMGGHDQALQCLLRAPMSFPFVFGSYLGVAGFDLR